LTNFPPSFSISSINLDSSAKTTQERQILSVNFQSVIRKGLLALVAFLICAFPASAQHGTASSGYYPAGYQGDTWTGIVASVNPNSLEITLQYANGKKTQTFVGVPEQGYLVHQHDGKDRPLSAVDVPVGRKIMVWYIPETKKIDGKKVKVNTIILIDIAANAMAGDKHFMAFGL